MTTVSEALQLKSMMTASGSGIRLSPKFVPLPRSLSRPQPGGVFACMILSSKVYVVPDVVLLFMVHYRMWGFMLKAHQPGTERVDKHIMLTRLQLQV